MPRSTDVYDRIEAGDLESVSLDDYRRCPDSYRDAMQAEGFDDDFTEVDTFMASPRVGLRVAEVMGAWE